MKKIVLALFFSMFSFTANSFVENTVKGYANCMACHVAPNGGGLLNNYGRSLSAEMMSTWKVVDGFERPFYGALKNSEHLTFGGQVRTIQIHAENNQVKIKKQFTMQNNVEFAAKYMQMFLVGTVGKKEGPDETKDKGDFLSERHFLLWEASADSRLRFGKFRQHFGINHPNHTRFVKSEIGFGSNSETYNLEFSKFFEWGEVNTSASLGDFFDSSSSEVQRKNLALNITHYQQGSSRIGFSGLIERDDQSKTNVLGVNAVYSLFRGSVFRSEVNYVRKRLLQSGEFLEATEGLYGEHQLGYQMFKGGLGYLIFEHAQSELGESLTQINSPGVGFQLLPIPHVEFQVEYQRRTYKASPNNPDHRSFLTFHLYH